MLFCCTVCRKPSFRLSCGCSVQSDPGAMASLHGNSCPCCFQPLVANDTLFIVDVLRSAGVFRRFLHGENVPSHPAPVTGDEEPTYSPADDDSSYYAVSPGFTSNEEPTYSPADDEPSYYAVSPGFTSTEEPTYSPADDEPSYYAVSPGWTSDEDTRPVDDGDDDSSYRSDTPGWMPTEEYLSDLHLQSDPPTLVTDDPQLVDLTAEPEVVDLT